MQWIVHNGTSSRIGANITLHQQKERLINSVFLALCKIYTTLQLCVSYFILLLLIIMYHTKVGTKPKKIDIVVVLLFHHHLNVF